MDRGSDLPMDEGADDDDAGVTDDTEQEDDEFLDESEVLEMVEQQDQEVHSDDEDQGAAALDPVGSLSILSFNGHTGDVFSVDSFGELVASGAEDDKAFCWGLDGQVKFEVIGHKDSVTWVRFNSKGSLLASGDMSGLIQISNVSNGCIESSYECGSDLEWLCWHPTADILIAGSSDGNVWMWLVINGQCKVYAGPSNIACSCGALINDGKQLLAGYADSSIRIWDLKLVKANSIASNIESPITCIDVSHHSPLAAIGFDSGVVIVINLNSLKIVSKFECFIKIGQGMDESGDSAVEDGCSVETVAFDITNASILISGCVNGLLTIWDLNSCVAREKIDLNYGIVKVVCMANHNFICATLNGFIQLFDVRNGEILKKWREHSADIFDICVNSEKDWLITAGGDKLANVIQMEQVE